MRNDSLLFDQWFEAERAARDAIAAYADAIVSRNADLATLECLAQRSSNACHLASVRLAAALADMDARVRRCKH